MKKIILLISLAIFISFSPAIADENGDDETPSAFFIRGGLSDVTGYVAGEYISGNIGYSIGWHNYTPSITDATSPSIDIGLFFYGAPYYENSTYFAIGYASANSVQTIDGRLDDFYPTWSFVGGYRFGGDFMDLKIGVGYLTSKIVNSIAIDCTIGFTF